MTEIINTFHLDWHIIVAQLVNFALVVAVLWYFALKPLARTMAERSRRIEQGVRQAKEAAKKLAQADKECQAAIAQGRKEAQQLIEQARALGEQQRTEVIARAKVETEKILEASKQQLAVEREKTVEQARAELAEIVALATEKIIEQKLTPERDHALVERAIREAKIR